MKKACFASRVMCVFALMAFPENPFAQSLINIDFGSGAASAKTGMAATGIGTNDFWNLYRHYDPKFMPGTALVLNGKLDKLKFADHKDSPVSIAVSNAPGLWGNASGDPMYDSYIFSQNASNIVVSITGLTAGRYHFYLYGHADADVTGEQNSVFTLKTGTNTFGPSAQTGATGWKTGQPWQELAQYVVMRDVAVEGNPVIIEVAPGPNGVAVLNGMQIISRGTSPPRTQTVGGARPAPASTNLLFREIHYDGQVSESEAKFAVSFSAESMTTNEISATLFEGEVALITQELPEGLRIVSQGREMRLFCTKPGSHTVKLELVARINKAEPWNQITFLGPPAAIATLTAKANAAGVEMQLLSGTQMDAGKKATSQVTGFLSADRLLNLRWQSKAAEVTRKSLVTVETAASVQISPAVLKYTTSLHYEILQAAVPQLTIALPAAHALTRIQGEQIRDWQVKPEGDHQVLTVEFIKPVEKSCALTLFSEQTLESTPVDATLTPPQPLGVERESGSFTLNAEDTTVEITSAPGLRQVNAEKGALAAYRFNSRPVGVHARLNRIEPALKLADRVTARLEETRLLAVHALTLQVEKAGIYSLELTPQSGMIVSEVKGEGIDDWKVAEGKIKISFSSRVLGSRRIEVQLTQAQKEVPPQITIQPLTVTGVTNVTTYVGAATAPGIRVKTADLKELREVPIDSLPERSNELLAFVSEQPGWKLILTAEKLSARVVAEVFNLVTVGDGLVGGSATIRFGILNQGVQQFRISVPAQWKNVEFTGSNIRRKEQETNVWTISLQDKAWGGYTLVLTYDYQFDPKGSTLDLAGAHPLDVERETGSLGLMTAASLKLTPAATTEPLQRVDEAELSESDRTLCTRPLLLAYKYTGSAYRHSVEVTRFEEVPVLAAVADRIELTTVLTEEGQLLTQSSFMVKNNEKQFQKFKLPVGATFWSSYVNAQPAKPERDGDWWLVPLPRDANRDQAFAVDIVYAQKIDLKKSLFPRRIELAAPVTDIPNTYAEWQLFMPVSQRLSGFQGNMTVARGTTYDLHDVWQEFVQFYGNFIEHNIGAIVFCFCMGLVIVGIGAAARRGFKGAVEVFVVFAILAVLAAMLLPALSKAKMKAQRINAMSSLKQIGLAARTWSQDNGDALPPSFEAMKSELGSERITMDPSTGQRFVYVGAGKSQANPEAIIAYSPSDMNGRAVLFADGSVQQLNAEKFEEARLRDEALPRAVISANAPAAQQMVAAGITAGKPTENAAPAAAPAIDATRSVATSHSITRLPAGGEVDANTGLPMAVTNSSNIGGLITHGGQTFTLGLEEPAKATASGVRPIRIDVPRTGQAFSFTKVLNSGQEPLKVSVSLMRLKVYRGFQMALQVCAFLIGLAMLGWLAMQAERNSFRMAIAAALIIWAVARLLMMWRLLHYGLIIAVPILIFGIIGWAAYRVWKRRKARRPLQPSEPPSFPPGTSGAAASALLLGVFVTLSCFSAGADEKAPVTLSNTVSIVSASYSGVVKDKVAQFDAAFQIFTTVSNQIVPLFAEDVAIESFAGQNDTRLVREGASVGLLIPGKGKFSFQLKLVAKLGGDVSRRRLAFGIPPALSSQVTILIDESEADVEFPTAVSFQRASSNQQTRVTAVIGSAERLELNWTPRVKRAAEILATVFAQNTALVTLGSGVANTRSTLDYQVSQGELRQLRVQIASGQRLLRVEGEAIKTWEVKEDVLIVELLKNISPAYKLTIETEKVLDKIPAKVSIEIPHALGVKRETGLLGLKGSEEISMAVQDAKDLQRVDVEEFHRAAPDLKDGVVSAFRFLKTDFGLTVQVEPVQPQIEAVVRNEARINSESIQLKANIDYQIKRAGIFTLRLALPTGYRLDAVTGKGVSQWIERTGADARMVDVTLKERTTGAFTLNVMMSLSYAEPPKSLQISGIQPLGVEKLSGFITVVTEQGVAAKTESLENLTEIPFAGASGETPTSGGSSLAYKFISTTPGTQPDWSLKVSTEAVEPWVRAEVVNTITLTETLVSGRTLVKYDVANAPVKEFKLRVPAAFKNVEINGSQIRRRDETNGEWRVELQGKVRGEYILTVTWEFSRVGDTNLVELEGIQARGVERETGFLGLVARPPVQVVEKKTGEFLSAIDVRELPDWAGRPDSATVLAYRYVRPGWKLTVEARRFGEAAVLQALIDSARFTSVIADDGQMMTEVSLSIRNNGRQHLEVELPAGATVWSAFVAGEPIRPGKREGKLLFPLAREVASEAPVAVEFTFISTDKFPKNKGTVALASPSFDVPLKNSRWDLYLPPDYDYSQFQGTMTRSSDTTVPMVQVYSLSEYNVQQKALEEQKVAEMKSDLSDAKKNLKGSNLRQAISSYGRAKTKGQDYGQLAGGDADLKEVEQDLRKAQSSNLISAQNGFYFDNAGKAGEQQSLGYYPNQSGGASGGGGGGGQPQSRIAGNILLNYDSEVAGLQWDKLQKAQQVATSKVSPLRVNLPTRGVHYSFSQVLQTEERKPMTIKLEAENNKATSWIGRILLAGVAFLVLWMSMAMVSGAERRKSGA